MIDTIQTFNLLAQKNVETLEFESGADHLQNCYTKLQEHLKSPRRERWAPGESRYSARTGTPSASKNEKDEGYKDGI